jgi:cation transport ATPase
MSIISDLLGGGLKGLASGAAEIIKTFKADPNKLVEAEQKIKELENKAAEIANTLEVSINQELTKRIESENLAITDRWKADSTSDSWMSKNSRPLTLLSLLFFLYVIILSDSIEAWATFNVKESYVDLLQILLTTVVVAYFGGRSYEKGQSIKKK